MSHIAVWTDEGGCVELFHYRPDDVDTSGATEIHYEPPSDAGTADWVDDELYYDESVDEFYFESNDPFEGLNFSDAEKQRLYDAVQGNDLFEARNIVEEALQS